MLKRLWNLIKHIFGGKPEELPPPPKEYIVCPRCLRSEELTDDLEVCPECNYELPIGYIRYYADAPPLFVQVFGWSQHGKTMFLDVLRLTLMDDIYDVWPRFTHSALSQIDQDHQTVLETERRQGKPPGSTQKRDRDQNEVFITMLEGMERWNNRMLVVMDHAGERFENFNVPVEEIPYLVNNRTTLMLISLKDLQDTHRKAVEAEAPVKGGTRIDQLLQIYLNMLQRHAPDFETEKQQRNLVVVFTKADEIRDMLPPNLQQYVEQDEIYQAFRQPGNSEKLSGEHLMGYLERMKRVSNDIEEWLQTGNSGVPGARAFVRLTNRRNINTRYTLISATGQDIETARGVQLMPRRVLDPFFWALEFQSE